jgi:hypothetical protein
MEDEMGRACSTHGAKRNAYKILIGKPEGKIPLEDIYVHVGGRIIMKWTLEK